MGVQPCFFGSLRINFNAAWAFRFDCTRKSRTSPSLRFLTDLTLGFDVTLTGFETAEIDLLLDEARSGEETDPADKLPAIDDAPPVSRIGDLWRLGAHRLLCADARDPSAFERLLGGEKAGLVFTDPPYNVPIRGNVCGRGQARHGEFVMASGEMSERAYTDFLGKAFRNLAEHSRPRWPGNSGRSSTAAGTAPFFRARGLAKTPGSSA